MSNNSCLWRSHGLVQSRLTFLRASAALALMTLLSATGVGAATTAAKSGGDQGAAQGAPIRGV